MIKLLAQIINVITNLSIVNNKPFQIDERLFPHFLSFNAFSCNMHLYNKKCSKDSSVLQPDVCQITYIFNCYCPVVVNIGGEIVHIDRQWHSPGPGDQGKIQ